MFPLLFDRFKVTARCAGKTTDLSLRYVAIEPARYSTVLTSAKIIYGAPNKLRCKFCRLFSKLASSFFDARRKNVTQSYVTYGICDNTLRFTMQFPYYIRLIYCLITITALSIIQIMWRKIMGKEVGNVMESIHNETFWPTLNCTPGIYLEGLRKIMDNTS
jgi:hypothetical protein